MDKGTQGPSRVTTCLKMTLGTSWRLKALIFFIMLVVMWAVVVVDLFLPKETQLAQLGIRPRTALGLLGVVLAPMLHSGLAHALTNSIGLVMFGVILVGTQGLRMYALVTSWCWLVGGFGLWCAGSGDVIHRGFAGVSMGQMGYIIAGAFFEKPMKLKRVAVATLLGTVYVFLMFGMFGDNHQAPWQMQIAGCAAGVVFALGWGIYIKRQGAPGTTYDANDQGRTPEAEMEAAEDSGGDKKDKKGKKGKGKDKGGDVTVDVPVSIGGQSLGTVPVNLDTALTVGSKMAQAAAKSGLD